MRNPFAIDAFAPVTTTALGALFVITVPLIALCAAWLIVLFGKREATSASSSSGLLTRAHSSCRRLLVKNSSVTPSRAILFPLAILLLPVAAGIAILKYRLYEIDLLINRTIVYGSLTAILAGAYVASVGLSHGSSLLSPARRRTLPSCPRRSSWPRPSRP